jgi:Fe2+ or Zn2+ uptake regulation protein
MRKLANGMQELAAKGLRATPQRIAIFEALIPRRDHPTVEVLYQDIHARYPSMSLNTVYTTLVSLEKAGLIQRKTDDCFITSAHKSATRAWTVTSSSSSDADCGTIGIKGTLPWSFLAYHLKIREIGRLLLFDHTKIASD